MVYLKQYDICRNVYATLFVSFLFLKWVLKKIDVKIENTDILFLIVWFLLLFLTIIYLWNRIILFSLGQNLFYIFIDTVAIFIILANLYFFSFKKNPYSPGMFIEIICYGIPIIFCFIVENKNSKLIRKAIKELKAKSESELFERDVQS